MAVEAIVQRPPRILHVLNHSFRQNGNVHAAVDLACAQADLGCRVALCSSGGSFDEVLAAHGVETFRLDLSRRPVALLLAMPRFAAIMRAWRPTMVHAHMMTSALLAWLPTRVLATPLTTTVHNAFQRSAILMALGDRVIAVSRAVRDGMAARGVPAGRLRVVLNGTAGSARHPVPAPEPEPLMRPAILYVGGLHPRKGVADLIEAMKAVHAEVPAAHLYLVGEGPHLELYRELARDCGFIHFMGSRADPRGFLRAADVFVLASHADPAPLVIPEARSAGCAIVASAVDGIPELLDGGRAGRLFPSGQPGRLAAELLDLLASPGALETARRASLDGVERFSVARVAAETLEVYRELWIRRAGRDGAHQQGAQPQRA